MVLVFLIKKIINFYRYPLLLERLHQATSPNHHDKEAIMNAKTKIEKILEQINSVSLLQHRIFLLCKINAFKSLHKIGFKTVYSYIYIYFFFTENTNSQSDSIDKKKVDRKEIHSDRENRSYKGKSNSNTVYQLLFAPTLLRDLQKINWFPATNFCDQDIL